MAEIIKETIATEGNTVAPVVNTTVKQVKREASGTQMASYVIYYLLGALEILLTFRFVFKLTGASMASPFVSFIYTLTSIFILPFEGIFRKGVAQGIETAAVFEPSTIVAIIVYAIIAWGLVKLVDMMSGEPQAV